MFVRKGTIRLNETNVKVTTQSLFIEKMEIEIFSHAFALQWKKKHKIHKMFWKSHELFPKSELNEMRWAKVKKKNKAYFSRTFSSINR